MKLLRLIKIVKILVYKTHSVSLHRKRLIKFFKKSFSYGNKRDKSKAHNVERIALLRLKNGQAEQNKLPIPRGQNPEYAGVLQNPNSLLF